MNVFRVFWMVWCPFGDVPRCQHFDRQKAEQEAERLANLAPGKKFYVLEAMGQAEKATVTWSQPTEDSEIPF